jgi:hypothetical protein
MNQQHDFSNHCFVCNKELNEEKKHINTKINLPVCKTCKGSDAEKKAEKEALDSLADGFICGCI